MREGSDCTEPPAAGDEGCVEEEEEGCVGGLFFQAVKVCRCSVCVCVCLFVYVCVKFLSVCQRSE